MTMPNMTGMGLAQEILKIRPGMPIILCTGFNERINAEESQKIGIRAFALKPLFIRDLVRTIQKVIQEPGT
jgi:YesN/AraC family two-component response regulator